MLRAQMFLLRPTASQAAYMAQAVGIARMTYNWALSEWKRQASEWWETSGRTEPPNTFALQRQFNAIKRDNWPWVTNVSRRVTVSAIMAVGRAFEAYRAGQAKYPRLKAKGKAKDSFLAAACADECVVIGRRAKLARLGWVRLSRSLRWPEGKVRHATISRRAGKWYLAILFEIEDNAPSARAHHAAGVDLGIKSPVVVYCGGATLHLGSDLRERTNVQRRRLRRATRALNRRSPGSGRRERARRRVARIYKRLADIRGDFQHKATALISRMATNIGVENLHVAGMLKNRRLAKSIANVGFYEIKKQLGYKAVSLVEADRFYPSSKTCSCCGSKRERLALSERTFVCEECGFTSDRDENAARNLEAMAADRAVSARGDRSPARRRKLTLRSLSEKRERKALAV